METKKVLLITIIVIFLIVLGLIAYLYFGKEKPDPIATQCAFACESGQKTSFCLVERTLTSNLKATCDELSKNSQYSQYNVAPCSAISCVVSAQEAARAADQTCITGLGGTWESPIGEGTCPQTGEELVNKLTPSDNPPIAGQICCG